MRDLKASSNVPAQLDVKIRMPVSQVSVDQSTSLRTLPRFVHIPVQCTPLHSINNSFQHAIFQQS